MALIKCSINGTECKIDESVLTPFRIVIDNDNEYTVNRGWKLYGAVVQNDIDMVLKQGSVVADAMAASLG